MKRAEKEAYLRDYEVLKKKGKPFFPYAVLKDATMALVVAILIVVMSILLGAEQGPKVDPTTTTYTPRPEWYFFFLFELLRVIKPVWAVPIATVGIPTLAMVLLLLLPFYDRNPERRGLRPDELDDDRRAPSPMAPEGGRPRRGRSRLRCARRLLRHRRSGARAAPADRARRPGGGLRLLGAHARARPPEERRSGPARGVRLGGRARPSLRGRELRRRHDRVRGTQPRRSGTRHRRDDPRAA